VNDLARGIARLARTPVLLVATDYDGTLAPIVADPGRARPLRESVVALPHTLEQISQTDSQSCAFVGEPRAGEASRTFGLTAKEPLVLIVDAETKTANHAPIKCRA
jgi:hypothetical protein